MNMQHDILRDYHPGIMNYTIMLIYLVLIFMLAYNYQRRHIDRNPVYKYFTWGLFAKIAAAVFFGLIYLLYYKGAGDTFGYFKGAHAMVNMLFYEPKTYFTILINGLTPETLSHFTIETGYPTYRHDSSSFMVNRITSIFLLFGFKDYFTSTILFAAFFYWGTWKLFLIFTKNYPAYTRHLSWGILFFPSVLFWASGIYQVLIKRKKIFQNITLLLISGYFIIMIKAYILVALFPGILFWVGIEYLKKINSPIARFLVAPLVSFVMIIIALSLLSYFQDSLGEYGSPERIVEKAIITYEDHSRYEQYGSNFYSLGEFDGTITNFLSKAPMAITAGFFRPFISEVRNMVMVLAGFENTFLLLIVFLTFWRTGIVKGFQIILDEPLVIFSLLFAFVFAFAVGVSTANFGALVRLKTPMLPFFAASLAILFNKSMEYKKLKEAKEDKKLIVDR